MTYGEKISHLRKSNGMTQEDLGKVLNVTYQAVSKWERGESLPDFNTMSQIAKFFQVPLSYFEDGGENEQPQRTETETAAVSVSYIGTCTVCGKMLKDGDDYETSPKIKCRECIEREKEQERKKAAQEEQKQQFRAAEERRLQRGSGIDAKLIVSLILAAACYIVLSIFTFGAKTFDDSGFYAIFLLVVPLAVFALTHAVFDLINEIRDKDDGPEGYTRNLSFVVGGVFAAVNLALMLTAYFLNDKNIYFIILLVAGVLASFTFVSQYMWGSVVRDIFTCGGFTFKLPGFIFSLTPESIIWMIVTKIFLGLLSILVFIATSVLFAIVAIFGSVFTFIPCVIYKTVKDKSV